MSDTAIDTVVAGAMLLGWFAFLAFIIREMFREECT